MTITQAIAMLQTAERKHGGAVEVYFDCPRCGQAFAPSTLVTTTLHVRPEPSKES